MELYLIRHAHALPGEPDEKRPLSEEGRRAFAQVVRGLEALGVRFDRVYTSPLDRAKETAAFLLPLAGHLEETPLLATFPSPDLLKAIKGRRVALVGHEPWLSSLAAWLVLGIPLEGRIQIKKGGVALLKGRLRPGGMVLISLSPPRFFRALQEEEKGQKA
ncbi:MAG: phosphohistidine phosphatase [Thermus sp.]|uniref:SixA phosphatase family protein n=1 Tax=Thermus sp. TaxID=275 RepID=UPI00332D1980